MGKTAKYLLVTILTLLVLFTAAVTVCAHLDFFTVKDIYILNNYKYDDSYFTGTTQRYSSINGFRSLYGNVSSVRELLYALALRDHSSETAYLKSSPYIKSIKVSFNPPSGLKIDVMERQETYIIRFLDRELIISSDFIILGENNGKSLPEITGAALTNYETGSEIRLSEEIKTILIQIKSASVYKGRSVFEKISRISFEDGLKLMLVTGTEVVFGSSADIDYKMKCLNDIYYEYLYEHSGGSLDLSDKDMKVYHPG
jgi:hypothetical protein